MNYVRFVDIQRVTDRKEEFLAILTRDETTHYLSLNPKRRAFEWLAGRLAAKLLIQERTGQNLSAIEIETIKSGRKKGRPYFKEWFLSISHSNGVAGAAISKTPVGLDIELVSLRTHMEQIAFSPDEVDRLNSLDSQQRAQTSTRRWTELEAIAKYKGTGLRVPFNELTRPQETSLEQGTLSVNGSAHCWTVVRGYDSNKAGEKQAYD